MAIALATPASATTFYKESFTCPIGGEKFKADVVVSNISFGQRPDGKPYSPLPVYPIVECPENGLLLFDDEFTDEELAALAAAIASAEFKAMRATETQHFRAAWLKEKAGRSALSQVNSLLQASWETDTEPERKIRYQAEFVNTVMRLERTEENAENWFWFNMRAVNALRELGYFAEGLRHLDKMMAPEHLPRDEKTAENALFFGGELRALLEQENPYPEPANLVPADIAMFRCIVPKSALTSAESQACAMDEVRNEIDNFTYKPKGEKKLKGEAAIRAASAGQDL